MKTKFVAFLFSFMAGMFQETLTTPPPNFLFIVFDDFKYTTDWDHSYNSLGKDLNGETVTYIKTDTPNIQQFIDDGSVIIPRTYANPLCTPSRYALLTGRYPSRNEYARIETEQPEYGTHVIVRNSIITGSDSIFNVPKVLQSNAENPFYTGHIGKWQMMEYPLAWQCDRLSTTAPDETKYQECVNDTKSKGFDFVDAYYEGNIGPKRSPRGHNPEWMVQQGQKFIDIAVDDEQKPFFLYFAFTLTHYKAPTIADTLTTLSAAETPRGTLTGDDIPDPDIIGMKTRDEIYNMALSICGSEPETDIDWEECAGTIWVDDAVGALLNYLKDKDEYDNTFIVIMNDHGQAARGTLYEQGTRIIQFVRYPELFNRNNRMEAHVVSEDLITNGMDLAAVVFDIVDQHQISSVIPDGYILDGESWINDVVNDIEGRTNRRQICCKETYVDIQQSHAIISNQYLYIWRAEGTTDISTSLYAYGSDIEQLYDLFIDPSQQNNLINDAVYQDIACEFRNKMIDASSNYWCYADECNIPDNSMCSSSGITGTSETTGTSSVPIERMSSKLSRFLNIGG